MYVPNLGDEKGDVEEFDSVWAMRKENLDYIAEDAAISLWYKRNGWEWMRNEDVKMVIMSQDKIALGEFEISIDFNPSFYAHIIR